MEHASRTMARVSSCLMYVGWQRAPAWSGLLTVPDAPRLQDDYRKCQGSWILLPGFDLLPRGLLIGGLGVCCLRTPKLWHHSSPTLTPALHQHAELASALRTVANHALFSCSHVAWSYCGACAPPHALSFACLPITAAYSLFFIYIFFGVSIGAPAACLSARRGQLPAAPIPHAHHEHTT
jgi:hypothetical protein